MTTRMAAAAAVGAVALLAMTPPAVKAGKQPTAPARVFEDRDRDGLDDRLEAELAAAKLPVIHEFHGPDAYGLTEDCAEPSPRPVLYRARPRFSGHTVDATHIAITYVLLYNQDCGAEPHAGDAEPFTVFLSREANGGWRTIGALAIAHRGTAVEQRSFGSGDAIWVSRNKHSNFANLDACTIGGLCTADGPSPRQYAFLNVGEPSAPMSNDVGDIGPAGASFRGRPIWSRGGFASIIDLRAAFRLQTMTLPVAPPLPWDDGDD